MRRMLSIAMATALVVVACGGGEGSDDDYYQPPPQGRVDVPGEVAAEPDAADADKGRAEPIIIRPVTIQTPDVDAAHPTVEGFWPAWAAEGGPFPAATDAELQTWIDEVVQTLNETWFTPHMWSGYVDAQIPVAVVLGASAKPMRHRPWHEGNPPVCGDTVEVNPNRYCKETGTMDWQLEDFHARNRQGGWPYVFRSVAHEFGHHLQYLAGSTLPVVPRELQAECLAGEMLLQHGGGFDQVYEIEAELLDAMGGSTSDGIAKDDYLAAFAKPADPSTPAWTGCFDVYGWPEGAPNVVAAGGTEDTGDVSISVVEVEGGVPDEDVEGVRPAAPSDEHLYAVLLHWQELSDLWSWDPEAAKVFLADRNVFACSVDDVYAYFEQMPPDYSEVFFPIEETIAYDPGWEPGEIHMMRFTPDVVLASELVVVSGPPNDAVETTYTAHIAILDGWTYHYINYCGG